MPVGGNFRIQLIFHRYGEVNVENGYVRHVHLARSLFVYTRIFGNGSRSISISIEHRKDK